eukprot:gnl/TRDRNA2_/TRDRNA2_175962_c15_seq1.p1 gnl/TRDRNA2_/TRDRNA2_175962_c15~~gnl/TRDRNA2_/TRDRNA2_175962_c15_seq1.p1  ORF type:complete len:101 (+),score=0.57 gnl/TRDRNA2_/TRDRNA2_175962_c15_seq1:377-679(+)
MSIFSSSTIIVAKAHDLLARACTLNSLIRRSDAFAKATKSPSSRCLPVAKAHAILASCCALNSCKRYSAALTKAVNSVSFGCVNWLTPTVASAHAVLVNS